MTIKILFGSFQIIAFLEKHHWIAKIQFHQLDTANAALPFGKHTPFRSLPDLRSTVQPTVGEWLLTTFLAAAAAAAAHHSAHWWNMKHSLNFASHNIMLAGMRVPTDISVFRRIASLARMDAKECIEYPESSRKLHDVVPSITISTAKDRIHFLLTKGLVFGLLNPERSAFLPKDK
jgi:hypothetical protein